MKPLLIAIAVISLLSCRKEINQEPSSALYTEASNVIFSSPCNIKRIEDYYMSKLPSHWIDFYYNRNGLPDSAIYEWAGPLVPDGSRMLMFYDKLNRLTRVEHGNQRNYYFYSGISNLHYKDSIVILESGIRYISVSTCTYDASSRLRTVIWRVVSPAPEYPSSISRMDYTYNYNGAGDNTSIIQIYHTYEGGVFGGTETFTFSKAKSIYSTNRIWKQIYSEYSAHERHAPITVNSANLPKRSRSPMWQFGSWIFGRGEDMRVSYTCE